MNSAVLAAQLDREHQILDGAGRALAASEGLELADANTQVAAAQGLAELPLPRPPMRATS